MERSCGFRRAVARAGYVPLSSKENRETVNELLPQVRCYACSRWQPRDAAVCGRCGATFQAMCSCHHGLSVFDDVCPACKEPHVPKRLPASRHPAMRAAKWTADALSGG